LNITQVNLPCQGKFVISFAQIIHKIGNTTGDGVFERIFLPVVKYTPLHPPLGKGGMKGGEAKASQGGTTENERKSSILGSIREVYE